MKKLMLVMLISLVCLTLVYGVAFAGNGAPSGKHFQFNIIGKKNNDIKGDESKGRSIMIPLKTAGTPSSLECEDAQGKGGAKLVDDEWPNWASDVPENRTKLYFEVCDNCDECDCNNWEIIDRDAIEDNIARIGVPSSMLGAENEILFDVYIRVMGTPLKCMEINGWAYDGSYYFKSGTVYLSKKHRTTFLKINELFDVHYCAPGSETCGTEISVFADVFENYFWELINDGTKVVQVRIYPQTPQI